MAHEDLGSFLVAVYNITGCFITVTLSTFVPLESSILYNIYYYRDR